MTEENFTEASTEEETFEIPCEDDTEVLLKKFDKKRNQKIDDIVAMQAVICVLLTVFMFAAHIFYPDIFEPIYGKLRGLISDEQEIMPNLIDVIMEKI